MAQAAFNRCMSALESEIGQVVIEGCGIKIDDVLVPPLVFRMAVPAIIGQLLIQSSMKSLFLLNILGYIRMIMALETAISLIVLVQGLVATLTLLLKLGMPGNHLPRTEEQIQFSSLRRKTKCEQLQHDEGERLFNNHESSRKSVGVYGVDVNQTRHQHQEEERQMQQMPK